jgi:hypothetical protein
MPQSGAQERKARWMVSGVLFRDHSRADEGTVFCASVSDNAHRHGK